MAEDEFTHLEDSGLLQLWARVMAELRERGVIRSSNNPLGDYCELLVASHFGVAPVGGSNPAFDLVADGDKRIQVKGRRLTSRSQRVGHFSVMHGLETHAFDEVVAVVLNENFSVREVWRVPWVAADRHKRWNKANKGYVLAYTQQFLTDHDVTSLELNIGPGE